MVATNTKNKTYQYYGSKNQDSTVDLNDSRGTGARVSGAARKKLFLHRPALRPTNLPIQRVPDSLSVGVKRPGREIYQTSPSSAEFKNGGYHLHSQFVIMTWCVIIYAQR
jgi:hypothetical protein